MKHNDTKDLLMSIKNGVGNARSFADKHLTLGLAIATGIGLALTVKFMWDEAPEAQEAIKKKKEIDPKASNLELAAAAAPHLKKSIAAVAVTGGCIVLHEYVGHGRLMAATAFGAAAFSKQKSAEEKLEELLGKKKATEVKAEKHGVTPIDPDNLSEGYTDVNGVKEKQEMGLNKIYRCILDLDDREIFTTPRKLEETAEYIRKHYGKSATTNWRAKPFELQVVGNLLGVRFGDIGTILGYPSGEDFRIEYTPGFDKATGEMVFIVTMTQPKEDWNLPFA